MPAMLIAFPTQVPHGDLEQLFAAYARALQNDPGWVLVMKTWVRDEVTLGRSQLFTGRVAAETYLPQMFDAPVRPATAFLAISFIYV